MDREPAPPAQPAPIDDDGQRERRGAVWLRHWPEEPDIAGSPTVDQAERAARASQTARRRTRRGGFR